MLWRCKSAVWSNVFSSPLHVKHTIRKRRHHRERTLKTFMHNFLTTCQISSSVLLFPRLEMQQGQQRGGVKDKEFALSLLHSSLKTYRLVQYVWSILSDNIEESDEKHLYVSRLQWQHLTSHGKETIQCIWITKSGGDSHKWNVSEGSNQLVNHAIAFMVHGITGQRKTQTQRHTLDKLNTLFTKHDKM